MREFTLENARSLISKMRVRYGKKFTDQWAAVEPEELEQAMIEDLSGLTIEQLKMGYERMRHEAWPPSLPEFRNWCLQGSNWISEYEAWVHAVAYDKSNDSISISIFVREALQQIRCAFGEINPKSETQIKAFREIYQRIVTQAKQTGKVQTFTPVIQQIQKREANEVHAATPCPPELAQQIRAMTFKKISGRVS